MPFEGSSEIFVLVKFLERVDVQLRLILKSDFFAAVCKEEGGVSFICVVLGCLDSGNHGDLAMTKKRVLQDAGQFRRAIGNEFFGIVFRQPRNHIAQRG